ncbi:MAG: DNA-binding domain-containing protein, partial [Burkholderiales bacterium]
NNLNTLQKDFVSGIFDSAQKSAELDIVETKISAADRLAIYRNNSFTNLRSALQGVYPVVNKLVGDDFFNHAANEYVRITPSVSGDLHDFGMSFADFLASFGPARNLAYLPDVAKLEWACHRVFHAADHVGLDLAGLRNVAPERYGELQFDLHPAVALLASEYPTQKIWQVNQDDFIGNDSVDLGLGENYLLVSRAENFTLTVETLSAADYAFLLALKEKNTLEAAAEKAIAVDAHFALGASLQRFAAQKILADFNL